MPIASNQTNTSTPNRSSYELPLAGFQAEVRSFVRAQETDSASSPLATAELVFTTGAAVLRYDYWRERAYYEVLSTEPGAIRLGRLERGAPLLDSHMSWSLSAMLGVVDSPSIADGRGACRATFSRRDEVAGTVQDVEDGVVRNVSVGYARHRIQMEPPEEDGGTWTYRVIDWEPLEVSLVGIPADADAQVVRSSSAQLHTDGSAGLRTFTCQFIDADQRSASTQLPTAVSTTNAASLNQLETRSMPQQNGGQTANNVTQSAGGAATVQRSSEPSVTPVANDPVQAERTRSADILALCQRHGQERLATDLIARGNSIEQAREAILNTQAGADSSGQRNVGTVQTVRDEMQVRMAGIEQVIMARIDSRVQIDDNGRRFRGMSLLEIGREFLEAHGQNVRGLDRLALATRMLNFRSGGQMGTSDFSSLFANIANKRLRNTYEENPGTYTRWARRAPNAPDFKSMSVVQISGAPDLLKVNEAGEFTYGKFTDGAETYGLVTYGRIVSLTRQAIINDDLRAFERLVAAFGSAAARLENRLVYSQLTGNPKMSDGVDLFHATHGNLLAGAASALQFSALVSGRSAMRLQKGLSGEELNLAPSTLIVPSALEQTAYQLTSSNYVPAKATDVNEFRSGGRTSLEPVVEPILDAVSSTGWYLMSNNSQIDTVEYCYLDGAEGPVIESEMGFEVDGVSYKCRLDFAAKAVDHRGMLNAKGV